MNIEKLEVLRKDKTLCCDLSESEIEGHHLLCDLAKETGHASLRSALNDYDGWGFTVSDFAELLIPES